MRLNAPWMDHPGTQAVFDMIEGGGHCAYFVGGCVRNGLLDAPVDDIDLTTDAEPDRVVALAKAAGLKAVPTGIDHGTVTVIADGKPHEITTLRRDVSTDGRRATVAFTDDLAEDAARRDFTINALYATRLGEVIDPTGEGQADLAARRVRFIGAPGDRIHEDYLRILRFFRFHAWYADPDGGLDPDGLAACAERADGIEGLSKERIGAEVKKLLSAPDPGPAVAAMSITGVLMRVLPGAVPNPLWVLIALEERRAPDPIRRLAAIGGSDAPANLRLSKAETRQLDLLRQEMAGTKAPGELGYRFGLHQAQDILLLRAAMLEQPLAPADLAACAIGAHAQFPLKAADLMPDLQGPELGTRLKHLEDRWIASGFTLDHAALLALP